MQKLFKENHYTFQIKGMKKKFSPLSVQEIRESFA